MQKLRSLTYVYSQHVAEKLRQRFKQDPDLTFESLSADEVSDNCFDKKKRGGFTARPHHYIVSSHVVPDEDCNHINVLLTVYGRQQGGDQHGPI